MFQRKNAKFVLSGPFDAHMPDYYLIITDIEWWIKNEETVLQWIGSEILSTDYIISGVVLTFKREKDVAAFLLKWN
jgi:hypothetical protein